MGTLSVMLFLCVVFGYETPVHAYIDPGSGSMMLQLLLGGVAGFVVIAKLYWRRLTDRFKSGNRPTSDEPR
jgi:hypothetical protein